LVAHQRLQVLLANEPAVEHMEGIISSGNSTSIAGGVTASIASESDSELSTVSSSRFSGLEDDWWKEQPGTAEATERVTVVRTRSKGKRVHWE
jgi:hypothetical protein